MNKKNLITLVLTFSFSIIIFFLIYKRLVYPTVIPMIKNGLVYVFADWAAIINANICENKGFNVYNQNPCDLWGRKHVYGEILLHLPLVEQLNKFYQFYFPIIINIIFVFLVVSLFNYRKSLKNYFLVIFIFSLPVLLAIERANSDILIFLILYLVSKYRNLFSSHFLIIISTLAKFYPICLGVIFLFQKNIKTIFINIATSILFLVLFLIFQYENLINIFNNSAQFSGSGVYQFSLNGLISVIPEIQLNLFNYNFNWLAYILIITLIVSPIILLRKVLKPSDENKNFLFEIINTNEFENRLYIVSSLVIIFCYFTVSNFVYREIFFLGLIPWLLRNEDNKKNFLDLFFYFICFKFLISTILIYLIMSKFYIDFNYFMNLIKHIVDFYIVSILLIILFFNIRNFFNKHFFSKKKLINEL